MSVFYRLAALTVLLTLVVIMLGAFVRLSDAGLSCPDWPGCYGEWVVPETQAEAAAGQLSFPKRPLDVSKAWKEMIHRYLAGTLGLLILALTVLAWVRRNEPDQQRVLPTVLLGVVIFQALLGMWTVTLLLKPLVVTAHLLGGMATLALLWLCLLRQGNHLRGLPAAPGLRWMTGFALLVLVAQIFLGAWTAANYAAYACLDFPTCHGNSWWPETNFVRAFTLWHGLAINYQHGILNSVARATIHWTHRLGALVTAVVFLLLAARLWFLGAADRRWRPLAGLLVAALVLQAGLGIAMVLLRIPLWAAVAHNGAAALLLLATMTVVHAAWRADPAAKISP